METAQHNKTVAPQAPKHLYALVPDLHILLDIDTGTVTVGVTGRRARTFLCLLEGSEDEAVPPAASWWTELLREIPTK